MIGPKVLAHSLKKGCLFSATVTPNLLVVGVTRIPFIPDNWLGIKFIPKIIVDIKHPHIIIIQKDSVVFGIFDRYLLSSINFISLLMRNS